MAKFRKKIENVEAVQVRYGRGAWPSWLEGNLNVAPNGGGDKIADGDYLVKDGESVFVLSAVAFEAEYESARSPKIILGATETSDRTDQ